MDLTSIIQNYILNMSCKTYFYKRVNVMEFIPFKERTEIINGQEYIVVQLEHHILRQRRLELGLTQAQVAEKAGILLRQYARVENGECSFRSAGARILLSICAVLRLDPYMFFPEIRQEPLDFPVTKQKTNVTVEVIPQSAKSSQFIPLSEYMELLKKVPKGKVVTAKTVETYFKKKYNVEVVVIETQGRLREELNMSFPFWRELSTNGQLYATTRFHSRDQQQRLLEEDGLKVVPCGANMASLKVENYKALLFDLDALLEEERVQV